MALIDNAVYVNGRRTADPGSLEETYEVLRERSGMAWIGLYRPDEAEIRSVAAEFELHGLMLEDAISAHQRPKLERYDSTLFVVLRPARYPAGSDRVEFGELHVFVGPDFVVTIRHADEPDLAKVRRRLEASPDLLRCGPEAVLYAILDEVVDEYAPVSHGCRRTSTRSRISCSSATRPSPAASTSSVARSSTCSARPSRWWASSPGRT